MMLPSFEPVSLTHLVAHRGGRLPPAGLEAEHEHDAYHVSHPSRASERQSTPPLLTRRVIMSDGRDRVTLEAGYLRSENLILASRGVRCWHYPGVRSRMTRGQSHVPRNPSTLSQALLTWALGPMLR